MLVCPVLRVNESPKSILNRYFSNVWHNSLHAAIGDPGRYGLPTVKVILGADKSVQDLCDRLHEKFKLDLTPHFYIQTEGFTEESPILWKNCKVPYALFDGKGMRICPQCINDEKFIHQATDFLFINSCPIHDFALYDKCPNCHKSMHWAHKSMLTCRFCSFSFGSIAPINLKIPAEKELLSWIEVGRTVDVEAALFVLNHLRRHFPEKSFVSGKLLELSVNIIKKNAEETLQVMSTLLPVGEVPNRLLLSPIFAALVEHRSLTDFLVPYLAESTTISVEGDFPKHTFRLTEVEFAFNVSARTIYVMRRKGLLVAQKTDKSYEGVTAESVYGLIEGINHAQQPHRDGSVAWVSFSTNIVFYLGLMLEGKLHIKAFDWAEGFPGVMVRSYPKTVLDINDDWLSIVDFANRAGTYPDAIRRLIAAKFIKPGRMATSRKRAEFHREEVEHFCAKYCFISEISRRVGRGRTILSAALFSVGVLPVSGPTVDGALIPLYLRSQVEDPRLDLARIVDARNFKCRSGRKVQGMVLYDQNVWASSKEVTKTFGLCPVDFSSVVKQGLLTTGVPVGREADNTRYYTRQSVESFKLFLSEAISEKDAINELGITRSEFLTRFINNGFCKVIVVGKARLYSKDDMQRMRDDCRKYVSLGTAIRILGTPHRHFYNLLRTKRIGTVSSEETITAAAVHLIEREKVFIHGVLSPEKNIKKAISEAKSRPLVDCTLLPESNF